MNIKIYKIQMKQFALTVKNTWQWNLWNKDYFLLILLNQIKNSFIKIVLKNKIYEIK
jgi:hypothetical protein